MVDLQKMMILNSKKASELDEKSMRLKKEHAEKVNLMYQPLSKIRRTDGKIDQQIKGFHKAVSTVLGEFDKK